MALYANREKFGKNNCFVSLKMHEICSVGDIVVCLGDFIVHVGRYVELLVFMDEMVRAR